MFQIFGNLDICTSLIQCGKYFRPHYVIFCIHAVNKPWQKWSSCTWWGSWVPRMRRKSEHIHTVFQYGKYPWYQHVIFWIRKIRRRWEPYVVLGMQLDQLECHQVCCKEATSLLKTLWSIDDAPDIAPDNVYFKMQMAMKIEEREFGAFDVILTN